MTLHDKWSLNVRCATCHSVLTLRSPDVTSTKAGPGWLCPHCQTLNVVHKPIPSAIGTIARELPGRVEPGPLKPPTRWQRVKAKLFGKK